MKRLDLNGASAIVTGGASGIGEASARGLAALGARVVVADLQEDKGQAVASELGGLYVKCDVSSEEDGAAAVAQPQSPAERRGDHPAAAANIEQFAVLADRDVNTSASQASMRATSIGIGVPSRKNPPTPPGPCSSCCWTAIWISIGEPKRCYSWPVAAR